MANTQFKCPNCSGSVVFSAEKNKMVCEFCGSIFEVDDPRLDTNTEKQTKNAKVSEELMTDEKAEDYWRGVYAQTKCYVCPSCGGSIVGTENSGSLFCPYCGNPAIIESNIEGEFKPDYIIPFEKNRNDAENAFKKFCGKGFFMPSSFKKTNVIEKVTGMYVPYHLYSCNAYGEASYKCERHTNWEDAKYYYEKIDTYRVERAGDQSYANVPADASKSIDDDYMESVEPFDYSKMVGFDMKYLSGFISDRYDVTTDQVYEKVLSRVAETVYSNLRGSVCGYDSVITTREKIRTSDEYFKYALMPVWLLRAKFKDKYYYFAMNGETGKAAGKMPVSVWKVLAFSGAIFLAAGLAAYLLAAYFIGENNIYIGLAAGAVAGGIAAAVSATRYKNVKYKKTAFDYAVNKIRLTQYTDVFVGSRTNKRAKPQDQNGNKR